MPLRINLVMFAAVLLLTLLEGNARTRAIHQPPVRRVLWVGAHPDDEAFVAPILGPDCVEDGADCTLLVFTRGERGSCSLPEGCQDLGSIRTAEMSKAAAILHAALTLWSFSDVGGDVDAVWSAEAGSRDVLVNRIASVIATVAPTVIYTFDPRHGSTCHPAHREVGALVLEAAARTSTHVELVETAVDFLPDSFVFRAMTPDAAAFDATSSWDYLVRDVGAHPSQFTLAQVESLRHVPAEQRRVWLATTPAQNSSCDR
jgi:LmbE family N-acetylglucosaminyl deacetylase